MEKDFEIRNGTLYKYNGKGQHVVIPDTVHIIHEKAFRGCETIISVFVPETVTWIEWGAFSFCLNLEKITLPSSLDYISVSAIEGCNALKTIIMEDNKKFYTKGNCIYSREDESYIIGTKI